MRRRVCAGLSANPATAGKADPLIGKGAVSTRSQDQAIVRAAVSCEFDFGSACLTAPVKVADRDDSLARVMDLRDLDLELCESLAEFSTELADASCPR
jgi:hypothetical protein